MATLRQILDKKTTIDLQAYGTPEGVEKAWDTRGRGGKAQRDFGAAWYHHSMRGESRLFHLYEGAGTRGGQWKTVGPREKGGREVVIHNSKREALDHIDNSQNE